MIRRIIIDETPVRCRAARLEDDDIVRLRHDYTDRPSTDVTALYRVKVTDIDRRLNAAFCDMGGGQSGFLRREGKLPPVGTVFLAEIKRQGAHAKGPDLSDRPIIRTPFATLAVAGEPRPGFLPGDETTQAKDFEDVCKLADALSGGGPLGLVDSRSTLVRMVMDLATGGVDEVVASSGALAAQLDAAFQGGLPIAVADALELRRALDAAEDEALTRTLHLSGGGRAIVDQAEALTAFDLDLGAQDGNSAKGAANKLLAAALSAIGRYASLAQLGGQIVIDVPRGAISSPKILRDQLMRCFKPLGRISVPAVTPEGICVVIAPKPGPSLLEQLAEPMAGPARDGLQFRDDVLAARCYEALAAALSRRRTGEVVMTARPAIAARFENGNKAYQALAEQYGARFRVVSSPDRSPLEPFHVV